MTIYLGHGVLMLRGGTIKTVKPVRLCGLPAQAPSLKKVILLLFSYLLRVIESSTMILN